jgi:YidC/Oxa1 family membrane protein insertase
LGNLWGSLVKFFDEILKFSYGFTHNYGVSIILMTILIRLILYPLMQKQMVSMREMQKIQPLMKEVQERYKNNKEKLNQELMKLYKEHKVNPMGGCLPLLIQMPILILLFQVLRVFDYKDKLTGDIVGGFLWIHNQVPEIVKGLLTGENIGGLAAPEQLIRLRDKVIFGIQLGDKGIFGIQYLGIMPFLIGASMYYQQKMTTAPPTTPGKEGGSAEQTQKMMTIMMPLLIAYMSFNLPSGLTLYWLVSTLLGIGQQYFINKKIPTEVTDLKTSISKEKEKEKPAYKKPEKSDSFQEEPWIPGYEKSTEKNSFKGSKKAKKYNKVKTK